MAISAKFLADFSDFQSAVAKADVSLKGLETGAGKVGTSLNKMANSLSGTKMIQDASLMAEAVNRIGGVSKLTESELARVGAQATEAANKLRAMGQDVPPGIQKIADAAKNITPALSTADKAAGLLKSTFAQFTLAGLATNAITSLTSGLMEFASIGISKFPAVEASFGRLTRAMNLDSSEMLSTMNSATKGMVSNYDLMLGANKAMLLGLPVTSESMGELASASSVLGKAMGQDATTSLNDLITALGRSSPMILDNLGLSVKVGEANEAYAAKLGKTAEALTDADKKMAFYDAAMVAARRKTEELGAQTMTLSDIATSVWQRIGDEVTKQAARINNSFGPDEQAYAKRFFAALHLDTAAAARDFDDLGEWIDAAIGKMDKIPKVAAVKPEVGAGVKLPNLSVSELLAIGDALDKDREAANKAASAFQAMFDRFSTGAKATEDMKMLDAVFRKLASSGQLTRDQIDAIVKEAVKLQGEGAKLTDRLWEMARVTDALAPSLGLAALNLKNMGSEIEVNATHVDAYVQAVAKLAALPKGQVGNINFGGKAEIDIGKPNYDGAVKAIKANTDWVKSLSDVTRGFDLLAQSSSGSVSKILGSIGDVTNALSQASSIMTKGGTKGGKSTSGTGGILTPFFDADATGADKWGAAIQAGATVVSGAMSVWSATAQDATKGAAALHGAMSGAKAGAAFGPYGMAIGAVAGAVAGMIHQMTIGRRTVEDFAKSFDTKALGSGFDELHTKMLTELGMKQGEEYWIKLTQGVKKGDKAGALAVINSINEALAKAASNDPAKLASAAGFKTIEEMQTLADKAEYVYQFMLASGKYSASELAKAFKDSSEAQQAALGDSAKAQQEALDAISDKYKETIDKLDSEMKSLSDSIAKEAPEEFMGIVEAQERARLEDLKNQKAAQEAMRDAEVAAKKSTFDAILDAGQKTYDQLRELFGRGLDIPYTYVPPGGSGSGSGGSSTPRYTPPTNAPGSGGESSTFTVIVPLDGEVLTKAVVKVAKRRGLT